MSAPIQDSKGVIIGALVGSTNLGKANFLDKLTGSRYGNTGYLLIAPKQRLIITATDKRRIMEQLPAPGKSPEIDRFLEGYEGSVVFINPMGVEVLSSDKAVPIAGWIVSGVLATSEAFAPIYQMQKTYS